MPSWCRRRPTTAAAPGTPWTSTIVELPPCCANTATAATSRWSSKATRAQKPACRAAWKRCGGRFDKAQINHESTKERKKRLVGDSLEAPMKFTSQPLSMVCLTASLLLVRAQAGDAGKAVKKTIRAADGVNLVCEVCGKGDTALVFLHGW